MGWPFSAPISPYSSKMNLGRYKVFPPSSFKFNPCNFCPGTPILLISLFQSNLCTQNWSLWGLEMSLLFSLVLITMNLQFISLLGLRQFSQPLWSNSWHWTGQQEETEVRCVILYQTLQKAGCHSPHSLPTMEVTVNACVKMRLPYLPRERKTHPHRLVHHGHGYKPQNSQSGDNFVYS